MVVNTMDSLKCKVTIGIIKIKQGKNCNYLGGVLTVKGMLDTEIRMHQRNMWKIK